MCARGYSNQLAGITVGSTLIAMMLSAIPVGIIASKTKKELLFTKIFNAALIIPLGAFAYLVTTPGHAVLLVTISILLGVTAWYSKLFIYFYSTHTLFLSRPKVGKFTYF